MLIAGGRQKTPDGYNIPIGKMHLWRYILDRSGLIELRKLFAYKEGNMVFGHFAGCFINTKKEIKGKFNESFLKKDSTTIHKFLDI